MAACIVLTSEQKKLFWEKVDVTKNTDDCWLWKGARKPGGYGNIRINKKYLIAHRVAYMLLNGKIPGRLLVCHTCDTPPCCNPAHLFLGTTKTNATDMVNKKRWRGGPPCGERNQNAVLTESEVKQIRKKYLENGVDFISLAEEHSVDKSTIGRIVRRETWRHI